MSWNVLEASVFMLTSQLSMLTLPTENKTENPENSARVKQQTDLTDSNAGLWCLIRHFVDR